MVFGNSIALLKKKKTNTFTEVSNGLFTLDQNFYMILFYVVLCSQVLLHLSFG